MNVSMTARHYAEEAARVVARAESDQDLLWAQTYALTAIALAVTQTPEPRTVKL